VFVDVVSTHYNPSVYADPYTFNPDRWLGKEGVLSPYELISFSAGPRSCLGRRFAEIEMVLAIGSLLRRYALALAPGTRAPHISRTKSLVTLVPTEPVRLCLARRF
jgi:cytochrome P450